MDKRVAQEERWGKYQREEQSQVLKGSHFPKAKQEVNQQTFFPAAQSQEKADQSWRAREKVVGCPSSEVRDQAQSVDHGQLLWTTTLVLQQHLFLKLAISVDHPLIPHVLFSRDSEDYTLSGIT